MKLFLLVFFVLFALFSCRKVAVQLRSDQNPDEIAEKHGFHNRGLIAGLEGMYLFEKKEHLVKRNEEGQEAALDLSKLGEEVDWLEEQVPRKRYKHEAKDSGHGQH
eukprot:TRINITY_DN1870_c0_g1_i1.p1 TRINITY_DN1870_c0_g1~~TRINITY_DN1870_c0_g1_i1.p1  ORF type:complete len:106 (-),score=22.05 TRINITY_DN1870_c0_g1_i1:269-586(-)